MRVILLGLFAAISLIAGLYERDGMTIGIGVASALGAAACWPTIRISTFLKIMSELFAVETVAFGLVDLANVLGKWPASLALYAPPRYLPVATGLFVVALTLISHIPFVLRMMHIADPFFEARTQIAFRAWPLPKIAIRQTFYARLNVIFLILVNQLQVAIGVRVNFFYRDFGNAIQVPDEAHRDAFWHQLFGVFTPLVTVSILVFLLEFYVAQNFVLQWRRWMTASYTTRWLLRSIHYKLALKGETTDNPDQRISEDIGGYISGEGGRGSTMNVGIYNYTIAAVSTATNLVAFSIILWQTSATMDLSLFGVPIPGFLFWVAVLYACFATGMMQLIGRALSGQLFRQQAVEANFRFDLARIREYSEQIALLKGEQREIDRANRVFTDVFTTVQRIIRIRTRLNAFLQFYAQISGIIPYVVVAPFYFVVKKVDFGRFNQAADAFGNVNTAMNFFVDRYTGLSAFSATVNRLSSFEAAFDRALADEAREPRVSVAAASGSALSIPNLDLALPDGRKLAHVGDLALIPQESTLLIGPSGSGKSTLFRAIAGLWSFGSGEILQPPHARLMVLPQRPYLPIGPLKDALAYPGSAVNFTPEQLRAALTDVGMTTFADRLEESDNWQMRLSGGEQQRLAVARALLAKPDWLLLDEATASLDEESENTLYRVIAKALPQATVVSIGHRSTLKAFHKRQIHLEAHPGEAATLVA
ncbi:MAG: ABC transporter ATP-binding protein/permease [Pseudomonadota bacterium]|nr:ABC transporter ATP-binding protein/permease [Pseudomonadota bacterium]